MKQITCACFTFVQSMIWCSARELSNFWVFGHEQCSRWLSEIRDWFWRPTCLFIFVFTCTDAFDTSNRCFHHMISLEWMNGQKSKYWKTLTLPRPWNWQVGTWNQINFRPRWSPTLYFFQLIRASFSNNCRLVRPPDWPDSLICLWSGRVRHSLIRFHLQFVSRMLRSCC